MADTELESRDDSEEAGALGIATPSPSPANTSSRSLSSPVPGPSGDTSNATASRTEGKSQSYFSELESNVEALQIRAQSLIDKINEKRSKDQKLREDFKNSLTLKVNELCQCLEGKMYQLYEQNNMRLQAKVQEFNDVMERIHHLQEELRQVCNALSTVYKDLGLEPGM